MKAPFARPRSTDHLFWLDPAQFAPAYPAQYRAYLVQFLVKQGQSLTFQFVNVADATNIQGTFTIDLTNAKLVWPELPSTIPQADGRPPAGADCGFLFLDHYGLDDPNVASPAMMLAADASGGGTGKYPKAG